MRIIYIYCLYVNWLDYFKVKIKHSNENMTKKAIRLKKLNFGAVLMQGLWFGLALFTLD